MKRLSVILFFGALWGPVAFVQTQGDAAPEEPSDEIVVEGRRAPFGSVPGGLTPVTTLSALDVRASGATTVGEALAAVGPQTGSAGGRGGGRPAVLVNGRRIASFQEVRDLPAEAIARIEVFDEQAGLAFGFPPDQRVVNIVLRRRYQANTVEAAFSQGAEGERDGGRAEASHVSIAGATRTAVGAVYVGEEDVSESERGVLGADARSLLPEDQSLRLSASAARALTDQIGLAFSLRADSGTQSRLLGAGQGRRDRLAQSLGASFTLDGLSGGWQWTATASADLTAQDSETISGASSRAASDASLIDFNATASGPVFGLPAGSLRMNGRLGATTETFSAASDRTGAIGYSELSRDTVNARMGLSVPFASRRREVFAAIGDLSVNGSFVFSATSDLDGPLEGLGYGVSWAPLQWLRFSLQAERTEEPPALRLRGDPLEVTPQARFFDLRSGQTVLISSVSGGNPALGAEQRDDLTLNAVWSPSALEGLALTASWARNETSDGSAALPTQLAETEAAFPERFVRDGNGVLQSVDARPVQLAARETAFVRVGFSYSRGFGEAAPPNPNAPPWGQGLPPWGTGAPPGAGGGGPPSFGGEGGGRRQGARPGRLSLAASYRERLTDTLTLTTGSPSIDLVARGGLDAAGEAPGLLEFQSWVSYRGVGARISGNWSAGYQTPGVGGVGALRFSERLAISARFTVALDQQAFLIDRWDGFRGVRLQLSVDNLTNSAVEVQDAFGQTPLAYQEAYQNPLGRVVGLSLRRQF
jgi:hypothetical protein